MQDSAIRGGHSALGFDVLPLMCAEGIIDGRQAHASPLLPPKCERVERA